MCVKESDRQREVEIERNIENGEKNREWRKIGDGQKQRIRKKNDQEKTH